jgi:hypothetical protein
MKKNGLDERETERREEHGQEDVEHPLLRVLRADLDDLLAVLDRRLLDASSLMFALMNSTARYAPVVTACVDAPVNQ